MKYAGKYVILILAFYFSVLGISLSFAQPVLVMDMDNKTVIFEEQSNQTWYPASITKLMTAYLIFKTIETDNGIGLRTKVTISNEAATTPYTKPALKAGQKITYEALIKMMLTRSSNGAAYALAEAAGGGNVDNFVEYMNRWAAHIGLASTNFTNPHGLHDAKQVTTASDIAILVLKILEDFPNFEKYFQIKSISWNKRKYENTNDLLKEYEGTTGLKTGYICASGYNLVATFNKAGRRILAITFGSPSSNYRFDYTRNLVDYIVEKQVYGNVSLNEIRGLRLNSAAIDMTSILCNPKRKVAVFVEKKQINGWGILFGSHSTKNKAKARLGVELAKIRGIIENGLASIIRDRKTKQHIAVLAGLKFKQAVAICRHLNKAGESCEPLSPSQLKSSIQ